MKRLSKILLPSINHLALYFVFSILIPISSWSQEIKTTRDIGLWFTLGLDYKINKKWNIGFKPSLRTFDNAIKIKKALVDIDVNYRINKEFKIGAGGRFDYARKNDYSFTNDIRYHLDFNYKTKLSELFHIEYRLRYQHKYINLFTYHKEIDQNSDLRNRLKIEYEMEKNSIYISTEVFRHYKYYRKPEFNNLRISVGNEMKTKLGEFDYSFIYERELNDSYPLNFFLLNVNYIFKFKHE